MRLRLDHLLNALRGDPSTILEMIDRDPMLLKRESSGLVLANASQLLYTPQLEHQLYAKGIVYRRAPYRLVSLPLIKIYNLGERNVTAGDLAALTQEEDVQLRFPRKMDGSLVQVFYADGRVWFTTRGMIDGAKVRGERDSDEARTDFDYLGTARKLAEGCYPRLFEEQKLLADRTLIFELIHPGARKVTSYGDREDLILLACFDRGRFAYLSYPELQELGSAHGLTVVDVLSPQGTTIGDQIADLLASLAGTDQEGSVLHFERGGEVIYRVKVKSPDYLYLMRLMSECTYTRTVEMIDANPHLREWPMFEAFLRQQGRDKVPEEVLGSYRQYLETYRAYLEDCERLRQGVLHVLHTLEARLGGREGKEPAAYRKAFAALAREYTYSSLLFAALDERLDLSRIRQACSTPEEVRQELGLIPIQSS